jgi:hypothetical protein
MGAWIYVCKRDDGVKSIRKLALAALTGIAVSVASSGAATAVTITFDTGTLNNPTKIYSEASFQLTKAIVSSGNCESNKCLVLNKEKSSTLSLISGGTFKLTDFWFNLLGEEASLDVYGYNGNAITNHIVIESNSSNEHHSSSQSLVHLFSLLPGYHVWNNLTKVAFKFDDHGSARIDNIKLITSNGANPSAVPVPGALPLLFTAMAGIGVLSRRRKRSV